MIGLRGNEDSILQVLHRLSDDFFVSIQLGGIDQRNTTPYGISKQINTTSISIRSKADLGQHNPGLSQLLAFHADSSTPGCGVHSTGTESSEVPPPQDRRHPLDQDISRTSSFRVNKPLYLFSALRPSQQEQDREEWHQGQA